jgi:serine/threonine protein kinase
VSLASGSRLGPYEIVSPLGAGGMGEVYRARDSRLKRDVAVKVLPEAFVRDTDRLARFEREAQLLASLNHPNIAQIHGLEEGGGYHALVMELVDGPTLQEMLSAQRGAMRLEEALPIAKQIAEALEAAHEQGIVHRDLKPANIKVRHDGTVKVLDFGLAKASEPGARPDITQSPTLASPAMTQAGIILGTAAYMSPEQAKGKPVDRRSDVWAFGCVLYEMIAGRQAFQGESVPEVLAGVIERDPDWSHLPAALPVRLHDLLRRCLEKDPKKRRRDIGDIRIEIEQALSDPPQRAAPVANQTSSRPARLAWIVAAILAVALAGAIARPYLSAPTEPLETRVDISTPETPDPSALALSPDGRRLVFVASRNGQPQLYLRSLDADTAQPLSGTEGARLPFWSPDSRSIGFFDLRQLKRIDVPGGLVQSVSSAAPGVGGTWGPDGVIVFAPGLQGPVFRVPAAGGTPVAVTTLAAGQASHQSPVFLPGGRQFLFYASGTSDARGIYVGSLDSGETTRLTDADTAGVYAPPGWLIFGRQGALVARRFDLARRELSGDPVIVAASVALAGGDGARAAVSVSATGVVAYRLGGTNPSQLTWFDRSGKALGTIGEPDRAALMNVSLSSDGRGAAVQRMVENNSDIWLIDSARTTRFTSDPSTEFFPMWSPDGTRIVFTSNKTGGWGLFQRASSGAGTDELLFASPPLKFPADWSPDGRFLLYLEVSPTTGNDLWVLPMDGDRKPFPFLTTSFDTRWGQFSPDGRWVAYHSNESGRNEIYARSFPGPGGQSTVSTSGGVYPRWSPDGKELFYLAPDGRLMAAQVAVTGTTLKAAAPVALFQTRIVGGGASIVGSRQQYDVASDGRFLINVTTESAPQPISLILNWQGSR